MANVLVIDDSGFSRKRVTSAVAEAGHTITEATNGQEGLNLIAAVSFDCVVSDNLMPVMEGVEMLRHLRAAGNNIPVIMCSADIQDSTRDECDELGVSGFIAKPFKPEQLIDAVALAIEAGKECAACD